MYLKIPESRFGGIRLLRAPEAGRLFLALLAVSSGDPPSPLTGREARLWPDLSADLLREAEMDRRRRAGNARGGAAARRPASRAGFRPPRPDEVAGYCARRRSRVDPGQWYDFYRSNGWMVGRVPMRDWKASVRTWERKAAARPVTERSYTQRPMTDAQLESLFAEI